MLDWTNIATFFAVITPLAGVPLTVMTFYLRALRDQYIGKVAELASRLERLEGQAHALSQRLTEVERGSTTREEWIRENMLARKERRSLTHAVIRIQCHIRKQRGQDSLLPKAAPSSTKPALGHGPLPQVDPTTKDDS